MCVYTYTYIHMCTNRRAQRPRTSINHVAGVKIVDSIINRPQYKELQIINLICGAFVRPSGQLDRTGRVKVAGSITTWNILYYDVTNALSRAFCQSCFVWTCGCCGGSYLLNFGSIGQKFYVWCLALWLIINVG